jgi:hypothetical protein
MSTQTTPIATDAPRRRRWPLRLAVAAVLLLVALLAFTFVPPLGFHNLRCSAPASSGCAVAQGRVVYIQRHDPDGGGDLHVILASGQSVSFPMLSIVKFQRGKHPHPPIGWGDWVSARGYLMRGSHQKEAVVTIDYRIAR